jgi:hypothetical protein
MVIDNGYKWILLQHEGCIAGLYYENVKSGTTIMRLGVTGDGTTPRAAPLHPQYHNCGFPSPPIGTPNAGLFLSFAVLHGLERVDMCRVEKRCTGLMIHYLGGRTSVLGQWHTSCASQSSCIYDNNGPAVTHIYFEMSRCRDRQIVTAVSFAPSTAETTSDSEYRVFSVGEVRQKINFDVQHLLIHSCAAYRLVVLRTLRRNLTLDGRTSRHPRGEYDETRCVIVSGLRRSREKNKENYNMLFILRLDYRKISSKQIYL